MAHRNENTPSPTGGPSEAVEAQDAARLTQTPTNVRSLTLTLIATVTAIGVLYIGRSLFVPILIGVGLASVLGPAVDRLERWHVPRAAGAAVLLLSLILAAGGIGYHVSGQAALVAEELPAAARRINDLMARATSTGSGTMARLQEASNELAEDDNEPPAGVGATPVRIVTPPPSVSDYLLTGSMGLAGSVAQVALVGFLVFFILASGHLFKLKMVRLTGPSLSERKITVQIIDEITEAIGRYLQTMALVCTIVGVATWLAFVALGMPNAALWGVLAAIANVVPYVGPTAVWTSATVAAYLHFDAVGFALLIGAVSLLITALEGMLLTPILMGRTARMNTVAMFVGLLFWGWLWGPWGLVLAVPLLITLKVTADRVEDLKPVGELLGE